MGSQVAQWCRTRLPMQETWVRSLGQEDPLEEEMATHSSILDWRSPWTEEPGGLHSMGSQSVGLSATLWTAARQAPLSTGDSPGKNTGVGGHALLQGIFLTQGSNLGLLHCRQILYHLSHHLYAYIYIC